MLYTKDRTKGAEKLLLAARQVFVEYGWCSGSTAMDEHGDSVEPSDEAATDFCMLGALERCEWKDTKLAHYGMYATAALRDCAPRHFDEDSYRGVQEASACNMNLPADDPQNILAVSVVNDELLDDAHGAINWIDAAILHLHEGGAAC